MRDKWYRDKPDFIKWSGLVHLARSRKIKKILQVALYRPDKENSQFEFYRPNGNERLSVGGREASPPNEVVKHFRGINVKDIGDIKRLGSATGLSIEVHKDEFAWNGRFSARWQFRASYFKGVVEKIDKIREKTKRPLIVFLDPDTGIVPPEALRRQRKPKYEHVMPDELMSLFKALKAGDLLVLYQHRRRDSNWLHATRRQYSEALGLEVESVEPITELVREEADLVVALLIAERI